MNLEPESPAETLGKLLGHIGNVMHMVNGDVPTRDIAASISYREIMALHAKFFARRGKRMTVSVEDKLKWLELKIEVEK